MKTKEAIADDITETTIKIISELKKKNISRS